MTTIDTTGLRTRAQSTAKTGGDIHIAPGSFLALLDALDRAEAERDYRRRENAELRDELVATQEYGAKLAHGKDEAEERIKAVRDALSFADMGETLVTRSRIRRALDGDA